MPSFKCVAILSLVCAFALGSRAARAQEPAKDNPSVPRFPGMSMESGREADFDGVDFVITPDGATRRVEGKSWEFTYQLQPGARQPSPLEIVRNYANQFTTRGGKVLYQAKDATEATMMMPLGAGERWLHLLVNNNGEQILMQIIETAAMKQKVEFSADEMAERVASTGKVILHGILFATGKSDIMPESAVVLDEAAAMMKKNAGFKFRIEGHTDNVGAKAANLTLSRSRAASVKAALVSRGIDAGRLTSEGLGDSQPVADNATDDGRQQNRRVELIKQ